jgi:hypothetical protein
MSSRGILPLATLRRVSPHLKVPGPQKSWPGAYGPSRPPTVVHLDPYRSAILSGVFWSPWRGLLPWSEASRDVFCILRIHFSVIFIYSHGG